MVHTAPSVLVICEVNIVDGYGIRSMECTVLPFPEVSSSFPHQSNRCVWKCSVCVRARMLRYLASQIVVNLNPSQPELGVVIPPLPSMHGAKGCKCDKVSLTDMRINHYLGSIGDFMDKTRRYWQVRSVVCAFVCLQPILSAVHQEKQSIFHGFLVRLL